MSILRCLAALAVISPLAACGGGRGGGSQGGGVQSPAAVAGSWGADCSQPFVKFDGGKITVFPDKATYSLTSVALTNGRLDVGYASVQGPVAETYIMEGATLRLDHGTYGGAEAAWHKAPMNKCS
jgi:hypothetical protein